MWWSLGQNLLFVANSVVGEAFSLCVQYPALAALVPKSQSLQPALCCGTGSSLWQAGAKCPAAAAAAAAVNMLLSW